MLKVQLEGQRLRFTDEQWIRLAVKAKDLGRRALKEADGAAMAWARTPAQVVEILNYVTCAT